MARRYLAEYRRSVPVMQAFRNLVIEQMSNLILAKVAIHLLDSLYYRFFRYGL